MANLVPRAFPLKVGRAGKSPGNEVEKWPEIKETKRESRIPILTYRKASATTVWSANSFSTVFHLLCKKVTSNNIRTQYSWFLCEVIIFQNKKNYQSF